MDDYTRYVTAVNKIFDYLEKMKAGWNNQDNRNYIEAIGEFKGVVTSRADDFRKPPTVTLEKSSAQLFEEKEAAEQEAVERERENAHSNNAAVPVDSNGLETTIPSVPKVVEALGE